MSRPAHGARKGGAPEGVSAGAARGSEPRAHDEDEAPGLPPPKGAPPHRPRFIATPASPREALPRLRPLKPTHTFTFLPSARRPHQEAELAAGPAPDDSNAQGARPRQAVLTPWDWWAPLGKPDVPVSQPPRGTGQPRSVHGPEAAASGSAGEHAEAQEVNVPGFFTANLEPKEHGDLEAGR